MSFQQKLERTIKKNNSLLCIGLDTDIQKLPKHLLAENDPIFTFNKATIDATHDLVCSYKINLAFYEANAIEGATVMKKTMHYLNEAYPDIPALADAKRGDIGNTSAMYAQSLFDYYGFDATTINPYLGVDSVEPFLKYKEKGVIILCRTSNPGAADFQDLEVDGEPLYIKVAKKVIEWNKINNNCLLVVGATWPEEMKAIRAVAPGMFFLVPGIGAQGGDLQATLEAGLTKQKSGLLMHSARDILYASNGPDFAEKARERAITTRETINTYR